MPTFKMASKTLTSGIVTRKITAADYPDALSIMDDYVDGIDGIFNQLDTDNLPATLTFDELLSGKYGDFHNYYDNKLTRRWHIVLGNGWIYSGNVGSDIGQRCGPLSRLDPHVLS